MSAPIVLYVAGPMRGIEAFNFPAFNKASDWLRAAGYATVNPAQHDEENGFDPTGMTGNEDLSEIGFDLREALAWDLDKIAKEADGIALLPGWEKSRGVAAEVATAEALGLTVRPLEWWLEPRAGDTVNGEGFYSTQPRIGRLIGPAATAGCVELHCGTDWDAQLVRKETVELHRPTRDRLDGSVEARPLPVIKGSSIATGGIATTALPAGEVRVVSATGGEKGRKSAELGTIDPLALLVLAEVSGFGAQKYAAFNYLKGYDWDLSYNALTRHLLAFWNGEDLDPESGLPHITHAAWHALALTSFYKRGLGTDTRYKGEVGK